MFNTTDLLQAGCRDRWTEHDKWYSTIYTMHTGSNILCIQEVILHTNMSINIALFHRPQ